MKDNTPSGPERSLEEMAKEYAEGIWNEYDEDKFKYTKGFAILSSTQDFKAGFIAASPKGKEDEI